MSARRRESPVARTNPSGQRVWVARYTNAEGKRKSAGTFARKSDAQAAIDAVYERPWRLDTVGDYFERWPSLHPRAERTQETNEHRVTRALDVSIEGRPLRAWPLTDLRRRHAFALLDVLLREQRRSARGAQHVIAAVALMLEDAINDELLDANPFRRIRVRATDPRITKPPRAKRIFSFEQMHAFAECAGGAAWGGRHPELAPFVEAFVRTFADTGLRLGEVLPLERADLVDGLFEIRRTAHRGQVMEGTKTDHGDPSPGRVVPCPSGLAQLIAASPPRIDTPLLFPTLRGNLWREDNFYRDIWRPAVKSSGMACTPQEFRASWESHLLAAGIDKADLAEMAGHTLETAMRHYIQPLKQSFDRVREVIG